jgi:hypothetical protein
VYSYPNMDFNHTFPTKFYILEYNKIGVSARASVVNSEGKMVLRVGLACLFSGLGSGLLTFYLLASPQGQASVSNGNMWFFTFLVIAVLLFISGFILTWLGFVWSRIDMYKQLKKNDDN